MKLFKCPNCGFSREASVTVLPPKTYLKLFSLPFAALGVIDEDNNNLLRFFETGELDPTTISCRQCGSALGRVEVEQCPHVSGEDYWNYRGITRHCRLCGVEQYSWYRA